MQSGRRSTSSEANPKPSVSSSLLNGGSEMGKELATTGGAARGEDIDVLNNGHGSFVGTLTGGSASEASFGAPPPPLAASVSRETSRRRRRILEHVEVGRGGQEHYHDAVARRRNGGPAETAGPPYGGFPADAAAADGCAPVAVDDGFYGDSFSPLERRSSALGLPPRTMPPPRGWDTTASGGGGGGVGGVGTTSRPKAKATKKRKNRSGTPNMDRRRAVCRFHAHGGRCARVCASSACPCGGGQAPKATPAAAAWRLPRAPVSAWR